VVSTGESSCEVAIQPAFWGTSASVGLCGAMQVQATRIGQDAPVADLQPIAVLTSDGAIQAETVARHPLLPVSRRRYRRPSLMHG
jgi:hypothetical protein